MPRSGGVTGKLLAHRREGNDWAKPRKKRTWQLLASKTTLLCFTKQTASVQHKKPIIQHSEFTLPVCITTEESKPNRETDTHTKTDHKVSGTATSKNNQADQPADTRQAWSRNCHEWAFQAEVVFVHIKLK